MFCTSGLFFGGTEGVGSHFHVLHAGSCFSRYRRRRVPFSVIARPNPFSEIPRASSPFFMFCVPELFFGDTEVVGSYFHVLRSRTRFRRYRGRRVPFSCFALPYTFLAVSRASGPVFMFCPPGLVFDGIECVGSRFNVLRPGLVFGGN
jgi:hypothetical protein